MILDLIPRHWTDDWELLSERLTAPPRLLVACDFDGTLAPLVPHPDKAELPASTAAVLRQLGDTAGISLAILSGRALADVRRRVPLPVDCFAGNHGLEMAGHGLDGVRAQAGALESRLAAIAGVLSRHFDRLPGLWVENKGLSLSIHYRNVDPTHWEQITCVVSLMLAPEEDFRVQLGHRVVEVLPSLPWGKGDALKQMAARLGIPRSAVIYVGDDTTDETAFRAIPNGTSISVGESRPSAAQWMARGPDDVRRLLTWVLELRC